MILSEGTIELPPEFLRRDAPLARDDLIPAELRPGRRDFLPVTEAVVTRSAGGLQRWEQPLVAVNLDRASLFAVALD